MTNEDMRADTFRAHLRRANVTRPQLFERTAARRPMRVQDLRAASITTMLANGRSETWVADRTGHASSVQINIHRRRARTHAELGLGELRPLAQAIPELARVLRGSDVEWPLSRPPGARTAESR